jgi:putative ABC transport system ATP-binding protein
MGYVQVNNLVKQYGNGEAAVQAVKGIDLEIQAGELVAIMGESGSGKSTLLSMMGALNTPTSGKYIVDEIDVYALGQDERADFRRNFLGFVFQSFHLVPYLTVAENVMLPLVTVKTNGKKKRTLAEEALARGPRWKGETSAESDFGGRTGTGGHRPGHCE